MNSAVATRSELVELFDRLAGGWIEGDLGAFAPARSALAARGVRVSIDGKALPPGEAPVPSDPAIARRRLRALAVGWPIAVALRDGPRPLGELVAQTSLPPSLAAAITRPLMLVGLAERCGQFAEPGYKLSDAGRAILDAFRVGAPPRPLAGSQARSDARPA